jgi:predicted CopG family antitoxin
MYQKKKQNKTQKTVVVLGTARSGTSIIGGILHILGIDIGKKLVKADKFNPYGYFEDNDFVNLSDTILEAAKSNYWQFPCYEKIQQQKEKFNEKIQKLIERKSKNKRIWGWKDPWTSLIIELILPYLINPHFIVIFRDPITTARSMVEFTKNKEKEFWVKKRINFFHALKLTNFHNKIILDFLEKYPNLPRIFISFGDVINNPLKEAKRITEFLGLEPIEKKFQEINKFVYTKFEI